MRVLILLGVLFVSGSLFASSDYWSELRALSKESLEESRKCDAIVRPIVRSTDDALEDEKPDEPRFKSKEVALKVLKDLEKYPGEPRAMWKALAMVRDKLPSEGNPDLEAMLEIQGCNIIMLFKLHKRLIHSATHYDFAPEDRRKVAETTLAYLGQDREVPRTIIDSLIRVDLLRRLADSGLIQPTGAQRATIDSLRKEGEEIKNRARSRTAKWEVQGLDSFKKLSIEDRLGYARTMQSELKDTSALMKKFSSLLSQLK
jgi:hypothetical protein